MDLFFPTLTAASEGLCGWANELHTHLSLGSCSVIQPLRLSGDRQRVQMRFGFKSQLQGQGESSEAAVHALLSVCRTKAAFSRVHGPPSTAGSDPKYQNKPRLTFSPVTPQKERIY